MSTKPTTYKMPATFNGYLEPYPLRIPTPDEMKMMIGLNLAMVSDEQMEKDLAPKLEKEMGYQIITRRLDAYQVPVSIRVRLICSEMCSNPGECVVMAWTLAKIYSEIKRTVTMDDLFMGPFGNGFPDLDNKEAGQKLWDSQKGFNNGQDCDNLLDRAPWPHQEG
jgi:hypothetical protein